MAATSFRNLQKFQERTISENRIVNVLIASNQLFSQLQNAESGQRGFLLTGKESYLLPYRVAVEKIDSTFDSLMPIAGSIPSGSQRVELLRSLSSRKLAEMQKTIDLYHSSGVAAALVVVETDLGLNDMTEIQNQLSALIEDGNRMRQEQREASVVGATRINLNAMLGGFALFLLLAFATYLIERDLQKTRLDALHIGELNRTLETRVLDRTKALEKANSELEAFCYSVSHDLRAPLRSVEGFSKILARDYQSKPLDARGNDLLRRLSVSTVRMGQLIEDLLNLSRISRGGFEPTSVDLSTLAAVVARELLVQNPGRDVEVSIEPHLRARGDARLLRIAIENLFGNAWKFTRNEAHPRLGFGQSQSPDGTVFFVRDNGAGFDMAHSEQLFTPFQRLHSDAEFEGTGIGLATVQRVVQCHGGRIWAESSPGRGATFHFTIQTEGGGS
jgi:signal transduction histidine kinase